MKTVKMIATGSQTSLRCGDVEYTPDEKGIWHIAERDVDAALPHGLIVAAEGAIVLTKGTTRETIDSLRAENERLKAELTKKGDNRSTVTPTPA